MKSLAGALDDTLSQSVNLLPVAGNTFQRQLPLGHFPSYGIHVPNFAVKNDGNARPLVATRVLFPSDVIRIFQTEYEVKPPFRAIHDHRARDAPLGKNNIANLNDLARPGFDGKSQGIVRSDGSDLENIREGASRSGAARKYESNKW